MISKSYSDSYAQGDARVKRTYIRFMYKEKYIDELVSFDTPKLAQKQRRIYTQQEVGQIID